MRRTDREIWDESRIVDIMSRCEVLCLALNTDTVPYILPVNFGMEADGLTLYFHGAVSGTKYEWIAKDGRASFEMDCPGELVLDEQDHSCFIKYESVIGWGSLEELLLDCDKIHALNRIMEHYHADTFSYPMSVVPRTRVFCLRVKERTAKGRY